jgi:type IV pilus assembly protein PilN
MIRINLLPFRAARKRENIKRQIGIYIVTVLIVIAASLILSQRLYSRLSDLEAEEKKINKELAGYKKELNEIKKLEKTIKQVKVKLNVIKTLEKAKTGPVMLLSDVADAVPKEKLWLKSLKEGKGILTLTGTAMDNETVALFMKNLENTKHITTVDLKGTSSRDIKEYRLKVSDFVLDCKTYAYKKKKPPKKKKK